MFLTVFLYFCVFRVFVHIACFLFLTQNSFKGIFARSSELALPTKMRMTKIENTKFQIETFATISGENFTHETGNML